MPVTFDVDPTKNPDPQSKLNKATLEQTYGNEKVGKYITSSRSQQNYIQTRFPNGFVGACITAYNQHYPLALSPDDVWITITTSLARYITANAERLRSLFVNHEGKITLTAYSGGNIYSADYDSLISQISDQIDKLTKDGIRDLVECNFSTTTGTSKIVSKVVLMGAMKEYFGYKFMLLCGLPKVTLHGNVEDWEQIRQKVKKLGQYDDKTIQAWAEILDLVLVNFVDAFHGKVDTDFWNRIAHITGGGSGPRYLEGWVLAFLGFDEKGKYFLNDIGSIQQSHSFGVLNTSDVPGSAIEVPVTIDDNGVEHETKLYGGTLMAAFDGTTISPAIDWVLVEKLDK